MTCSGRYAEAMDYGLMFQCGALEIGLCNVAGVISQPHVDDTTVDFTALQIAVGMPIRNATTGLYGKVTAVAATQLGTTGLNWSTGDTYWLLPISAREVATIEAFLNIAAGTIHVARQATDGCNCSLDSGVLDFLRHLNVVMAAVWHNCPCGKPNISDSLRQGYLTWAQAQIDAITSGALELCAGETGTGFPAIGWAEQGLTPWREAEIIAAYIQKQP